MNDNENIQLYSNSVRDVLKYFKSIKILAGYFCKINCLMTHVEGNYFQ